MKLSLEHIQHHELMFTAPLTHLNRKIDRKSIAVLHVCDEKGRNYKGEVGPLLGIHEETLQESLNSLDSFKTVPLDPVDAWNMKEPCFGQNLPYSHSSLMCAWEQILFQKLLMDSNTYNAGKVSIAALLSLNHEDYLDRLKRVLARGIKTAKVKVGRETFDLELGKLELLCAQLPDDFVIRLDANQGFSQNQLEQCREVVGSRLQFFEEPLQSLEANSQLNLPVAFDESLWQGGEVGLPRSAYMVVKPMRVGLSRVYQLLERGFARDRIILSSCFDSGISIQTYLDFALYNNLSASHGLGPYFYLKNDLLEDPIRFDNGELLRVWP